MTDTPPEEAPTLPADPCIFVPENFPGTEAEAVALAVAGVVADIAHQRDLAVAALADLWRNFPKTSWAQDSHTAQRGADALTELGYDFDAPHPSP